MAKINWRISRESRKYFHIS